MKKFIGSRVLSILLVIMMIIGLIPAGVYGATTTSFHADAEIDSDEASMVYAYTTSNDHTVELKEVGESVDISNFAYDDGRYYYSESYSGYIMFL